MGHSSQESGDSILALKEQALKPSGKSKLTLTAEECLLAISLGPNGTRIYVLSVLAAWNELTLSVEDFPAKTSAMLGNEWV